MTNCNYKRSTDKPMALPSNHLAGSPGDRWELPEISFRKFSFAAVMFCSPPTLPVSSVSSCPWANILWGDTFLSANKMVLLMTALLPSLKQTYKWENGLVPFSSSFPMIKTKIVVPGVLFLVPFAIERREEGCDSTQNKRAKPSYLNEEGQFGNCLLLAAVL